MELAILRGGLRFKDPATERTYREWSRAEAAPFIRNGMVASAVGWTLAALAIRYALPDTFAFIEHELPLIGATIVGVYFITYWKWRLPVFPLTALANAVAGLILVASTQHGLAPEIGLAAAVQVNFFAFTIFRLPVRWAIPAAATYTTLFVVFVWNGSFSEPLSFGMQVLYTMAVGNVYLSGILAGVVLERLSRERFRQETFITEQRGTIERMLQKEISHQVAERSKELGEALARVDATLPSTRLEPGRLFAARYTVVRELGAGGMGAVYEVERTTDGQRLALKVVTGVVTGAQAARFAREAEIGARLHHPNLVPIVDVGVSPAGAPFLVMELVTGGSLEDRRGRFGQTAWALLVLQQIAKGLAALHEAGVVHRDLKPANVLLSGDAEAPVARISDFGISRFGVVGGGDPLGQTAEASPGLKGQSLTRTGAMIGTPLYMAPEAARGAQEVGPPADVFAFGLIAYEALSGSLPFAHPPVLELQAGRPLARPAPLAGPLGELVGSCLETDPSRRPDVAKLVEAVAALQPGRRADQSSSG